MTTEAVKKVTIINEKNVTKEDIIAEANAIWTEVLKTWKSIVPVHPPGGKRAGPMQILNTDIEILNKLFEKIRDEHKEFSQSYPTVLRHMVHDKWYDAGAFSEYMTRVEAKPWTNDSERMDSYAEYAAALFRKSSKQHLNMTHLSAFKRDYRSRIQKEHDDFIKQYEEIEKEYNAERSAAEVEKRKHLAATFARIAPDAGMSEQKTKEVLDAIERGLIVTERLETLVYDLRRVISGVSPEQIRDEYIAHHKKLAEIEANTTIHVTDDMNKNAVERMKQLVAKQIEADSKLENAATNSKFVVDDNEEVE